MDYKRLIKALKCDGYGVGQDSDGCANKRCKYRDSDGACNIVSMCEDAATAITDLLARAEAAEARADKAERERDEAATLINYIYYQECDVPNGKIWLKNKIDEWRANKEG